MISYIEIDVGLEISEFCFEVSLWTEHICKSSESAELILIEVSTADIEIADIEFSSDIKLFLIRVGFAGTA